MLQKMGGFILSMVLITALGLGSWYLAERLGITNHEQKPALQTQTLEDKISAEIPVILETEYARSNKVVISDFPDKQNIIGYTLDELTKRYTAANGFNLSMKDGSLIIHQLVDDWAPADKNKYRLKEYRGMVAVYAGPDQLNDSLLKVTAISFAKLPGDVQAAISAGQYEFPDEEAVNDALENLDEYI